MPEKIQKQIELFIDETVGMVYCEGKKVNINTTPPEISDYYTTSFFKTEVNYEDLIREDYIGTTSQAIISKLCWKTVGGFYEKLPARQDYEMWMRISQYYRLRGVAKPLFEHTIHGEGQITNSLWKSFQGNRILYKKHKNDKKNTVFKRDFLDGIYLRVKGKEKYCEKYFYMLLMIEQMKLKLFHPDVFKSGEDL